MYVVQVKRIKNITDTTPVVRNELELFLISLCEPYFLYVWVPRAYIKCEKFLKQLKVSVLPRQEWNIIHQKMSRVGKGKLISKENFGFFNASKKTSDKFLPTVD